MFIYECLQYEVLFDPGGGGISPFCNTIVEIMIANILICHSALPIIILKILQTKSSCSNRWPMIIYIVMHS